MSAAPDDPELNGAFAKVQQNPVDLDNRFLLGECLFRHQRYAEAIPELQKARMNPRKRSAAIKLLAECFRVHGDQQRADTMLRELDAEQLDDDDEDDTGGAASPSPLKPVEPTITHAMNPFPHNETKNG